MDKQFVSIGMAAKMLGMSIDGLRKWEREGHLMLLGILVVSSMPESRPKNNKTRGTWIVNSGG